MHIDGRNGELGQVSFLATADLIGIHDGGIDIGIFGGNLRIDDTAE